ncbi:chlorophyll synthesis pathway protein BchC [Halorhodospira abdelmalekii]|uniref:chlorophyll synthesis pathway protein BchC n=1 Tax=Halorhodospira abdelmalekii TaxID=421629 RepID=UPI001908D107|nr:chlorophyll synthesis pathway protein BchC [Halorhodospira abdelmalekii]MBK1735211.1 chlorophyll synthesis pathway protein BchC [Halorhodospira abdelmalekii]
MSDVNTAGEGDVVEESTVIQQARAVVFQAPQQLAVEPVTLIEPGPEDVVVDIHYSGISTGTERLLWTGTMPYFPGLGYPLVPGYESVGRVVAAGPESGRSVGDLLFVPGASCFNEARGVFGGAASRVVIGGQRGVAIPESLGERGVLLALAATAWHAVAPAPPQLIIGHGVLGRLMARIGTLLGEPPTVWETNEQRRGGALGYTVVDPSEDDRQDYPRICDVSGDSRLLDTLISRLGRNGEVVLAGFYSQPLSFEFAQAFMREASIRIAAEWQRADLEAVMARITSGALDLSGLITHRHGVEAADAAYRIAFNDPECLKMILDWREG